MLALPGLVLAQNRSYRVAYLSGVTAKVSEPYEKMFFSRLAELGYREDRNLVIERRYAEGDLDRLPALAKELVALNPDLIVTPLLPPTLAALKATRTIPIVFVAVGDPLGTGIVKNLARPEGNATGTSANNRQMHGKQLQMLKEMLPGARRVVFLFNPLNPGEIGHLAALKADAPKLGLSLQQVGVEKEAGFPQAFKSIELAKPDALYVAQGTFTLMHVARIMEFANARKLPVVGGTPQYVEAGALMTYGSSIEEPLRIAAAQTAKILKGAKPADLPVEQVTVYELVINMKAAKAIRITIPQSVLVRADRVIE
jgi:putative ABC transport system substrate-binding protein